MKVLSEIEVCFLLTSDADHNDNSIVNEPEVVLPSKIVKFAGSINAEIDLTYIIIKKFISYKN